MNGNNASNGNTGTITIGATGSQTALGTCTSANSAHAWSNGKTGKYNASLNFDGTDDYVSNSSINLATPVTVSAWFKTNSFPAGSSTIFFHDSFDLSAQPFSSGGTNYVRLQSNDRYNPDSSVDLTGFTTGTWYHLVAIYGTTSITGYVNGVQNNTTSSTVDGAFSSSGSFYVGTQGASQRWFSGQIDDVRIYNYALTAGQIKTLYNAGSAIRYGPSSGTP